MGDPLHPTKESKRCAVPGRKKPAKTAAVIFLSEKPRDAQKRR
jgi:hypothetical protein